MRLVSIRLIVSLIVGITLVSLWYSYYEALGEKRSLRRDLERRAEVLGQGVAEVWNATWRKIRCRILQHIAQRFGSREHLPGLAIYGRQGDLLAVTPALASTLSIAPSVVSQALRENREAGFNA